MRKFINGSEPLRKLKASNVDVLRADKATNEVRLEWFSLVDRVTQELYALGQDPACSWVPAFTWRSYGE